MASISDFTPIKYYLTGWPIDIIDYPSQLDAVGVDHINFGIFDASRTVADGTILILKEISFDLPGIPGLSIALMSTDDITEIGFEFDLSIDSFYLTLNGLSIAIRFNTELLIRMEETSDGFKEAPPDPISGLPQPIEILIENVGLTFNSKGEFTFS